MVSVIIPNYNHAPYLQKRIESVINQTYKNLEIIILDDCSTDNSIDIINQYKGHPKIAHVIINTANSGSPFIQWEKAFKLVSGEIIWIAESDDYAASTFLEKLLPLFDLDSKIGIAYCDSNVVDAQNIVHPNFYKLYKNKNFNTNKWSANYVRNGLLELRENLYFECTINNVSATIFKKNLIQHLDFSYLKQFKYCGDWFFLISLLSNCDVAYNQEALNYFKYGTDNFKKGTKSVLNYFKERFMVRYYFWNELGSSFNTVEKKRLYKQLGTEMRIQINEVIKGSSSFKGTQQSFFTLYKINNKLFVRQLYSSLKSYIWKK